MDIPARAVDRFNLGHERVAPHKGTPTTQGDVKIHDQIDPLTVGGLAVQEFMQSYAAKARACKEPLQSGGASFGQQASGAA